MTSDEILAIVTRVRDRFQNEGNQLFMEARGLPPNQNSAVLLSMARDNATQAAGIEAVLAELKIAFANEATRRSGPTLAERIEALALEFEADVQETVSDDYDEGQSDAYARAAERVREVLVENNGVKS